MFEKILSGWLLYFCLLTTVVVFLLRLYLRQYYEYWQKLGVPHTAGRFPLGDFQNGGLGKNIGVFFKDLYESFPKERFFGVWLLLKPVLLIRDPELVKTIFVKDFISFHDRGLYYNEKDDPLSAHLFSIGGSKWKRIRAQLTPTFTSGKMKMMFPIVVECSRDLEEYLKEPAETGQNVDMKEVIAKLMTDVIALCAFGIRTHCLKEPKVTFREMGRKVLEPNIRNFLVFFIQFSWPELARAIKLRVTPKDVQEFFMGAFKDVMNFREKNQVARNDFMQLLIDLKNKGMVVEDENGIANGKLPADRKEKLTIEEAAAEAFVFFLGGFETSSATVQFALYELAKNFAIQKKLRREIEEAIKKYDGQMTYEAVHDIPYLDKVIDETLRKYPVAPTLIRECNKNYQVPDSDVVLPKGTLVHIPIYAIQRDPQYFPDPEKFDPERFSEEEKQKRHHYAYLPFGEGPRNCIGKRFALMQTRVALIVLLQNYEFHLPEGTKSSITFDPKSFPLLPKGGLNFKVCFRKQETS